MNTEIDFLKFEMDIKYNKIGANYNLTRKPDKVLTQNLIKHLNPNLDGLYLDIGCGTGNYTNELQKKGFQFIGVDPSEKMLKEAKSRNEKITWKIGTAENLDLENNSINGIVGSLTIHHWNNLNLGFSNLCRILKPGGKIVIFTSTPKQMKGYWLNHYFPKMLYDSIKQMPGFEKVKFTMEQAGLQVANTEKYFVKPDLEDKFLYCGKQNPEIYFDEQIRHGISSFSSLSNREEVTRGLAELRQDIDNGKINEVIKSYENKDGDYLYIVSKKPAENSGLTRISGS